MASVFLGLLEAQRLRTTYMYSRARTPAAITQARTTTKRAAAFHWKMYGVRKVLGPVVAPRLAAATAPRVALEAEAVLL